MSRKMFFSGALEIEETSTITFQYDWLLEVNEEGAKQTTVSWPL